MSIEDEKEEKSKEENDSGEIEEINLDDENPKEKPREEDSEKPAELPKNKLSDDKEEKLEIEKKEENEEKIETEETMDEDDDDLPIGALLSKVEKPKIDEKEGLANLR